MGAALTTDELKELAGPSPWPGLDFSDECANVDFQPILRKRLQMQQAMRASDTYTAKLIKKYEDSCIAFIDDWGMTEDPRRADRRLETRIPLVLMQRQRELVAWLQNRLATRRRGAVDKSRDCGASWIIVHFCLWAFLFRRGFTVGFGTRKREYIDNSDDPKSFFSRLKFVLPYLPDELLPSDWATDNQWLNKGHPPNYAWGRIANPDLGSYIIGEGGDQAGRGARATMYFMDESAFVANLNAAEGALSAVANVVIHVSSAGDSGNAYLPLKMRYRKNGDLFEFDFKDDERRDEKWEAYQRAVVGDKVFDREYGRDEHVDNPDTLIPYRWLSECLDAHKTLAYMRPSGLKVTGFDPSDSGDPKGLCHRHGSILLHVEQMEAGNFHTATQWSFEKADNWVSDVYIYDADGMGAPLGAPARAHFQKRVHVEAFVGGGGVLRKNERAVRQPKALMGGVDSGDYDLETDRRKNVDYYENRRAQAWYEFMQRVMYTFMAMRAMKKGEMIPFSADDLVSFDSGGKLTNELLFQLSQPYKVISKNGKRGLESKRQMRRRGIPSPNLADAVVYAFHAQPPPMADSGSMRFSDEINTWEY